MEDGQGTTNVRSAGQSFIATRRTQTEPGVNLSGTFKQNTLKTSLFSDKPQLL